MLSLIRVFSRGAYRCIRPSFISRVCRPKSLFQPIRWQSSSPTTRPGYAGSKKYIFPERLIVYHAGTGRSTFLGCLKVTTIFIFIFFCGFVGPTYWYAEEGDQRLIAAGVMVSGLIPMIFVGYVSGPFVAHVHLRLPTYARQSRDILKRYSQNLPKDAKLDITTMTLIGKPRLSSVKVGDLRPVKRRFGLANYIRGTKKINAKRPWYMGRAARQFSLPAGVEMKGSPGVWEDILKSMSKP